MENRESAWILNVIKGRLAGSLSEAEKDAMEHAIAVLDDKGDKGDKGDKKCGEWCVGCKEYDSEKHCCPRFNRVILETVQEMKDNAWTLVSESLPEEGRNVLLTEDVHMANGTRYHDVCMAFWDGEDWLTSEENAEIISWPLAWMEVPEAYGGK